MSLNLNQIVVNINYAKKHLLVISIKDLFTTRYSINLYVALTAQEKKT